MKIYAIQDKEVVYWSNELGWVDEYSATDFIVLPAETMPIGWTGVEA